MVLHEHLRELLHFLALDALLGELPGLDLEQVVLGGLSGEVLVHVLVGLVRRGAVAGFMACGRLSSGAGLPAAAPAGSARGAGVRSCAKLGWYVIIAASKAAAAVRVTFFMCKSLFFGSLDTSRSLPNERMQYLKR